jgi:hypothetical protein
MYSPYSSGSGGHDQNTSVGIFRESIQYLLALQCGAVSVDTLVIAGVEANLAQVYLNQIESSRPASKNDAGSS